MGRLSWLPVVASNVVTLSTSSMKTLPPIAVSIYEGGRAGSVATAQAGFALNFKAPADGNDQGLTPEHFLAPRGRRVLAGRRAIARRRRGILSMASR